MAFPHKIFRAAGVAIVSVMLVIGVVGAQFSRHYKSLIRARLPALSAKATDSLYDITIQDIRINIFTRTVTVYGMRMSVNPDVLSRRRAEGRPPHVILDVTVPVATVSGVRWSELNAERELDCRSVRFHKPEIRIQIMPEWKQRDSLRAQRPAAIRRVAAAHILIEEPVIDVGYNYGEEAFAVHTSGGRISAHDWDFHPRQPFDTSRFFAAASADVALTGITYAHPGAHYLFSLGRLAFNTDDRSASLQELAIKPAASLDSLYALIGHRTDIYDCSLPEARIDSLDWKALLAAHVLNVGSIRLRDPQLLIYLSKRLPPLADTVRPPYPHERLQLLDLPVRIGSIGFLNAAVAYSETNAKTGATGTILFNYLRGALYNITNDSGCIAREPRCRAFVSGKFMYRSDIAAMLTIDLASPRGAFLINGAVNNLDATQIREPVSAMALAIVSSLHVSDASVNIRGNDDSTWGAYTIRYNALRIKLKKWDEEDSDIHSRPLASFVANKLLLYDANPMPASAVRSVRTAVARGATRSFFRTVWKNIFQGIALTAVREEGAYDIAKRYQRNKNKQRQRFFKNLVPKRSAGP